MKDLKDNWLIFDGEAHLVKVLTRDILNIAKTSISQKNCFSIVLTGGKSVLGLYKILSQANSDWDKWHIYIGDERFLPKGHKDRNDRIINKIWLEGGLIPRENIHFIQAEKGLIEAQKEYEEVLRKVNKFDVVLLSMGEDGHIASLFPDHIYSEDLSIVIEMNSPKSPKERISMSYERLNKSKYILKLIVGESKKKAVGLLKQNENLPIARVKGDYEQIYICTHAIF